MYALILKCYFLIKIGKSVGEDMAKLELLYFAGGNVNGVAVESSLVVSEKAKTCHT